MPESNLKSTTAAFQTGSDAAGPNQGCHRREAPARGPRCSVSRSGPGSRQLGEPARTYDRRSFPTRTPAARAGSVGKPAVRRQVKPPQLDSNGVPSSSTASTQPILPAVGLGRGHELPGCCLWKHRPFRSPLLVRRLGLGLPYRTSRSNHLGRADLLQARTPDHSAPCAGRP